MSEATSHTPSSDHRANEEQRGRSVAEWVTLGISIAIIAAMVAVISFLYLDGADDPPTIATEPQLDQLRREDDGFYLPVKVTNRGDHTVENLVVQASLDTGDGQPHTAEFSLNFVAGGETVRGTFVFGEDPTGGDLTIGAASYTEP
jgi:uncharacterized protein (TIGR02588 family)